MMRELNIRRNLIVPNVSWGMFLGARALHECDLLCLTKSGYATEIEIKVSKSDLMKDKHKEHGHVHNHIARFYYAVPKKLEETALQVIPERAGLFVVEKNHYRGHSVALSKQCKRNKSAIKWTNDERTKLAELGAMRILRCKEKILRGCR